MGVGITRCIARFTCDNTALVNIESRGFLVIASFILSLVGCRKSFSPQHLLTTMI